MRKEEETPEHSHKIGGKGKQGRKKKEYESTRWETIEELHIERPVGSIRQKRRGK